MKYKSDKFYTFESMVVWSLTIIINRERTKALFSKSKSNKKKNIEAEERFQKITKKETNGKANCGYKRREKY